MKQFLSTHWYYFMIGVSALMLSLGFLIYSITTAFAHPTGPLLQGQRSVAMPLNADGSITVRLSDEQIDKLIPKQADGSIKVTWGAPSEKINVNIEEIGGYWVRGGTAFLPVKVKN